jgi:hypothetical protein
MLHLHAKSGPVLLEMEASVFADESRGDSEPVLVMTGRLVERELAGLVDLGSVDNEHGILDDDRESVSESKISLSASTVAASESIDDEADNDTNDAKEEYKEEHFMSETGNENEYDQFNNISKQLRVGDRFENHSTWFDRSSRGRQ